MFDTNHNGKLDAGDARFGEFKVWVNGDLVTLASLGIASIDLTPTGSGQTFADGSAITGTTTYTRDKRHHGRPSATRCSPAENDSYVIDRQTLPSTGDTAEN